METTTCELRRCSSNEAGNVRSAQVAWRVGYDRTVNWRCCLLHRTKPWSRPAPSTCRVVCAFHGSIWSELQVPTCMQSLTLTTRSDYHDQPAD